MRQPEDVHTETRGRGITCTCIVPLLRPITQVARASVTRQPDDLRCRDESRHECRCVSEPCSTAAEMSLACRTNVPRSLV
jgi:hypothetical protein|eukprot:SAG25_NODE_275_length_10545_cov_4.715968_2_plen_80_part_00